MESVEQNWGSAVWAIRIELCPVDSALRWQKHSFSTHSEIRFCTMVKMQSKVCSSYNAGEKRSQDFRYFPRIKLSFIMYCLFFFFFFLKIAVTSRKVIIEQDKRCNIVLMSRSVECYMCKQIICLEEVVRI